MIALVVAASLLAMPPAVAPRTDLLHRVATQHAARKRRWRGLPAPARVPVEVAWDLPGLTTQDGMYNDVSTATIHTGGRNLPKFQRAHEWYHQLANDSLTAADKERIRTAIGAPAFEATGQQHTGAGGAEEWAANYYASIATGRNGAGPRRRRGGMQISDNEESYGVTYDRERLHAFLAIMREIRRRDNLSRYGKAARRASAR